MTDDLTPGTIARDDNGEPIERDDDNAPSGQPVSAAARRRVKQPPMLFERTQELLAKIEKACGRKVLSYWTSYRGRVCDADVLALYKLLKRVGRLDHAALFMKSDGGDPEAALRIVHLIRKYVDDLDALVPLECASAATIIALGADRICMGPLAHLSAIDSSLRHDLSPIDEIDNSRVSVSQDELSRIVRLWNTDAREHHGNPYTDIFKHIHPLVVGAIDRSSSLSMKICREVLGYHIADDARCQTISQNLNSEYPSHSYPITSREAERLGLPVEALGEPVNEMLLELNELYSEMAQKALTDFDAQNYHDNEILNIIEASDVQVFYQNDKDWNYIKEERRWQPLNDESSWRIIEMVNGEKRQSNFHIR
ncbi:MAG: hypothetical protein AAGJ70_10190 [Pseudomonadota bacterium]